MLAWKQCGSRHVSQFGPHLHSPYKQHYHFSPTQDISNKKLTSHHKNKVWSSISSHVKCQITEKFSSRIAMSYIWKLTCIGNLYIRCIIYFFNIEELKQIWCPWFLIFVLLSLKIASRQYVNSISYADMWPNVNYNAFFILVWAYTKFMTISMWQSRF